MRKNQQHHHQPRIVFHAKLSLKGEGEMKTFTDKQKIEGIYCQYVGLARNVKKTKFFIWMKVVKSYALPVTR